LLCGGNKQGFCSGVHTLIIFPRCYEPVAEMLQFCNTYPAAPLRLRYRSAQREKTFTVSAIVA
jgi:hypothetical protein